MDDVDRLEGVVPTRRLLLSQPDAQIADLMVRDVVTVPSIATVRQACELFLAHRFLAFPVVHEGRMIGIVDVELFAEGIDDLERTKQQEDLFQLMGVHLTATSAILAVGRFCQPLSVAVVQCGRRDSGGAADVGF